MVLSRTSEKSALLGTFSHVELVRKGYLSASTLLYPNHDASFGLERIAQSGHVATNPGPVNASSTTGESRGCSICRKTVAFDHGALTCDSCIRWIHIKCGQVTPKIRSTATIG